MSANRPLWGPAQADEAARGRVHGERVLHTFAGEDHLTRLVLWPLRRPDRAVRTWAAILGVAIALFKLPAVVDGHWSEAISLLWYGVIPLAWVMLISIAVRTVTPRHLVAAWLMGVFTAGGLVDLIGTKLSTAVSGNTFRAVLVPVLEEGLKVLPVLLFAFAASRLGRGVGALDCAALGLAAGGGFGFYEDMLYGRMHSAGPDGLGTFFPTMWLEPFTAAGHLVWSGAVGLGIGIWITQRHRWWAWAVGPLLIALPVVDHGVVNFRGDAYDALRARMLDGRLLPLVLLGGLALALWLDTWVVHQSRAHDHLFQPAPFLTLLTARPPAPFGPSGGLRQAQRLRNEAVYRWYLDLPGRSSIAYELGMSTAGDATRDRVRSRTREGAHP